MHQLIESIIDVPAITLPGGFAVPAFKTMQFLASQGAYGTPYSLNTEAVAPWAIIDFKSACRMACRRGMTVLKLSQALAIAHDISEQDINWTGGRVGSGALFRTHSAIGIEARRWHQLSTGERIFDFAGLCHSWLIDDLHDGSGGLSGYMPHDSPLLTTPLFLSCSKGMGDYPETPRDWSGLALIHGGCINEEFSGVFCLHATNPETVSNAIGFRCAL